MQTNSSLGDWRAELITVSMVGTEGQDTTYDRRHKSRHHVGVIDRVPGTRLSIPFHLSRAM